MGKKATVSAYSDDLRHCMRFFAERGWDDTDLTPVLSGPSLDPA